MDARRWTELTISMQLPEYILQNAHHDEQEGGQVVEVEDRDGIRFRRRSSRAVCACARAQISRNASRVRASHNFSWCSTFKWPPLFTYGAFYAMFCASC